MMIPINVQIQNIKFQMNEAQSQLDFMQNSIQMMYPSFFGTQIKNLGIKILNIGLQMLNVGAQLPMEQNNMFFQQQIQNLSIEIQNIGNLCSNANINIMQMPNIDIPIKIMGMNNYNNQEFKNDINNNIIQNKIKKINITFKDTIGHKKNYSFNYGTTVNKVLETFLKDIGHPELINTYDQLQFLYNAQIIKFDDQTTIEKLFCLGDPIIIVNITYLCKFRLSF